MRVIIKDTNALAGQWVANQYGGIADVDFSSVFEKLNDVGNGV